MYNARKAKVAAYRDAAKRLRRGDTDVRFHIRASGALAKCFEPDEAAPRTPDKLRALRSRAMSTELLHQTTARNSFPRSCTIVGNYRYRGPLARGSRTIEHLGYNRKSPRMTTNKTIDAIYEDGVFKPKDPIDLDERTEVRLVIQHIGSTDEAIALLEAWSKGDAVEQAETWAFLKKALDEDRLSSRKLFEN